MNKREFIEGLRAIVEELKPLTAAASSNAAVWNGTAYVRAETKDTKGPDPYALAWFSTLMAIADLVEAQESPLSTSQIAYLRRVLFGGMGSFNDLNFDPKSVGAIAKTINERLDERRRTLFASFQDN